MDRSQQPHGFESPPAVSYLAGKKLQSLVLDEAAGDIGEADLTEKALGRINRRPENPGSKIGSRHVSSMYCRILPSADTVGQVFGRVPARRPIEHILKCDSESHRRYPCVFLVQSSAELKNFRHRIDRRDQMDRSLVYATVLAQTPSVGEQATRMQTPHLLVTPRSRRCFDPAIGQPDHALGRVIARDVRIVPSA